MLFNIIFLGFGLVLVCSIPTLVKIKEESPLYVPPSHESRCLTCGHVMFARNQDIMDLKVLEHIETHKNASYEKVD